MLDADTRQRFEAFARELEPLLRGIAMKLCGNHDDAQDLAQDTLEHALHAFHRLESGPKTRAWIATVMKNRFIDGIRRPRGSSFEDEQERGRDWVAPEPDEEPFWASVTSEQHLAAVEQLPADLRDAYRLKAMQGLSYRQVAKQLNISKESTVGTRVMRAREKLKEILSAGLTAGKEAS